MTVEITFQLIVEILPKQNFNGNNLKRKEFNKKKRKHNKQKEYNNRKEPNKLRKYDDRNK
jgi:hypothetical protein